MGNFGVIDRSEISRVSQVSSATKRHIDEYSASADERKTEVCFFDFQEMEDPPKLIKNPPTKRRKSGHDAQSASQNARREKEGEALRKSP